jgi:hypothetical protein
MSLTDLARQAGYFLADQERGGSRAFASHGPSIDNKES